MLLKTQLYKLKSGHYQVSVYNPASKKRKRLNFKRLRDAEQYRQNLLNQFALNGINGTSTASVTQWMDTYLELYPNAFIKRLGNPLYDSFIATFGNRLIVEITRTDVMTWISQLQAARNYSQKTIPNIKSAAQQFFQFLVDANAIQANPVIQIKIEKCAPKREKVILSESDINEILEQIKPFSPNQVYPVVFLLAHTGARLGEVLKLLAMCPLRSVSLAPSKDKEQ